MAKFKDLINQKFTKLLVIAETVGRDKTGSVIWLCKCDCGKEIKAVSYMLIRGDVKSCGCLSMEKTKERFTTHKMSQTKVYKVWNSMLQRCQNPNIKNYNDYGGRGIRVCEKWQIFEGFWEDMGSTFQKGLSIDRIDNDKGYSKENCHWTTRLEQNNNQRMRKTAKLITFNNKTLSLTQWAREIGLSVQGLKGRLYKHNWSIEKALTISKGGYRHSI